KFRRADEQTKLKAVLSVCTVVYYSILEFCNNRLYGMDTIMNTIEVIKEKLNLVPHPEGGFYRESYRSRDYIHQDSLPPEYKDQRHYSTCIYYLLTLGNFSAFHRIRQDEIWHFYDGTAIQLHTISPEGQYQKHSIGRNIIYGEFPQLIVP